MTARYLEFRTAKCPTDEFSVENLFYVFFGYIIYDVPKKNIEQILYREFVCWTLSGPEFQISCGHMYVSVVACTCTLCDAGMTCSLQGGVFDRWSLIAQRYMQVTRSVGISWTAYCVIGLSCAGSWDTDPVAGGTLSSLCVDLRLDDH
jgi:hypothetical protein